MFRPRYAIVNRPLLVALAAALLLLGAGSSADARSYPKLFGSGEQRGGGLAAFPKWVSTLERNTNDHRTPEHCTPGSLYNVCHMKAWESFIESLRGKDRMSQLRAVNQEMNRRRYIVDPVNWGLDDYWATPLQFFQKQGDCEDYAISKFLTLRALGVPNEDLRIVVLMDTNLNLAHAILVVYLDERAYVLDNQIDRVVRAETIRHYKPIYSINETTWWLHKPRG